MGVCVLAHRAVASWAGTYSPLTIVTCSLFCTLVVREKLPNLKAGKASNTIITKLMAYRVTIL